MKLIDVINRLEKVEKKERICDWGFGDPHSYRGYYDQLAFEPRRNSIQNMLDDAKHAVGSTFGGWKGGEFTMHEDTEVYIAITGSSFGSHPLTEDLLECMLQSYSNCIE